MEKIERDIEWIYPCKMNEEAQDTLFFAIDRFGLSNRALDSIKKVARTIADLDGAILITEISHSRGNFIYAKR